MESGFAAKRHSNRQVLSYGRESLVCRARYLCKVHNYNVNPLASNIEEVVMEVNAGSAFSVAMLP